MKGPTKVSKKPSEDLAKGSTCSGDLPLEEEKAKEAARVAAQALNDHRFRCRICGNPLSKHDNYYSDLVELLLLRFGKLLEAENGGSFVEGVLSSLNAIFSPKRKALRDMLMKRGQLKKYDKMFSQDAEGKD